MARKEIDKRYSTFENFHLNYRLPNDAKIKIFNRNNGSDLEKYNDAAAKIQELIQEASKQNLRLRPFGSRWSLSKAPYGKNWMLDNRSMNLRFDIKDQDRHAKNKKPSSNYLFAQSGNYIKELSIHLAKKKKSLKTSGASNGQTIAGAISTGVHGSALDVGSVQDFVVGLNLVISPTRRVYLERASKPILNDAFAQSIQSEVIRDDDLFNAALVGLGAFGFIHGVTVEVEDQYCLDKYIIKLPKKKAIELMQKENFKTKDFGLPKGKKRPYHYKIYLNPFKPNDDYTIEIIYKVPFKKHKSPIPKLEKSYYRDLPSFVSRLASKVNRSVPGLIKLLSTFIFPSEKDNKFGTLAELFFDTGTKGATLSTGIAVEPKDMEILINSLVTRINGQKKAPFILSVRFVKGTDATLGFTKFKMNAVVEIDGLQWDDQEDFMKKMTSSLENAPFDFTLHWGKNAKWSSKLVKQMYKGKRNEWISQRNTLIKGKMRKVFASAFLEDCGLS